MCANKAYEIKIRQLERKLKKKEAKILEIKSELSKQRQENKYNRRRIKELTESRDNWKEKHSISRKKIKVLTNKLNRQEKAARHQYDLSIVYLCILLRVICGCSYRGVSKIIKLLGTSLVLNISRYPCASTIQNWVTKMGFHQRQCTDIELVGQERFLIIDESIRIGKEKQLLVLSTPYKKDRSSSLQSTDVQVHYFGGQPSWNGPQISEVISQVIQKSDMVCKGILSDEGPSLKKASKLAQLPHLPDLCHAVGTCLKQTFEKESTYESLMTLLRKYRQKGVNRDLSYLLPPKQRTKARFLNVNASIKWAAKMLVNFNKLSKEEQSFFSELRTYQPIIATLKTCLQIAEEISLPLKEQGIGLTILQSATTQITQAKQKAQAAGQVLVVLFLTKLAGYITHYQGFVEQHGGENIPISSEIIESLFGVYKHLASPDQLVGATFLNFEMDVRCMEKNEIEQKLKDALEMTFMTDLQTWKKEYTSNNQIVRRRNFFKDRA